MNVPGMELTYASGRQAHVLFSVRPHIRHPKIWKDLKSVFFPNDFYGSIFLHLSCLKLAQRGSSTHHHVRVAPLSTVFLPLYPPTRTKPVGAEREKETSFPNDICFMLEVTNSPKLIGSQGHMTAEASKTRPPSFVLVSLVLGSFLVCTRLVSGWHKLWAFTRFLDDEDDITPDFKGFSITHEKQIVNCR
jgi:hypothetical protein